MQNGRFWNFLSKNYLRPIVILAGNEQKKRKNKSTFVMSILKIEKTIEPLFFRILYSLAPKIEICPQILFGQNISKAAIVHN